MRSEFLGICLVGFLFSFPRQVEGAGYEGLFIQASSYLYDRSIKIVTH